MAVPKEMLDKVKRVEETNLIGGNLLTPKQHLLDASDVQSAHPDKRVRFVSLRDPMKVSSRKAEGYSIVPSEEGGRRLGEELVLMEIPRERYEAKVKHIEKLNAERLKQHNREMEQTAEAVARILRDKHGIDVSTERILVREG